MKVDRKYVTWTKDEKGVATLVVNNPPMNICTVGVAAELKDACAELAADRDVVVVIVTGAGEKAFMAGADITQFPDFFGRPGEAKRLSEKYHSGMDALDFLQKPTIAAVYGYALGAGLELALACDIRIATEDAKLGLPEIKLGLLPGAGGTQRLPRLVGSSKAKEIMYTGDTIDAAEALRIGLVSQVVPQGQAMEAAQIMANKIAGRTLASLRLIKRAVDLGLQMSLKDGLKIENDEFDKVFQTEDIKEGVDAFLHKRPPQFHHR